jgi:ABC-2 type transport system ATP-binding protein
MDRPEPYIEPAYALVLQQVGKSFDGKVAVRDLSLAIRPGEFYGLLGANGAGKTTSLRMTVGLLAPDRGSIEVFGIDALQRPSDAKQVLAWLPDEPMLYDQLTPLEYLEFVAGLWRIEAREAAARAGELLDRLDLWSQRDTRCAALSRGMKQKVSLAGALVHDPRLLILDEPLTGLDPAIQREVKDLLLARTDAGCTIILATHILDVAERLVDRIGILRGGELVAEGTLAELRTRTGRDDATLEDIFLALAVAPADA